MLWFAASCGEPVDSGDPETLDTPAGLKVGIVTATTAQLSWTGVDNAEKYNLIIDDGDPVEVAGISREITGLTTGTEYAWKVQAVKGEAVSDWAEGAKFTTPPPQTGIEFTNVPSVRYGRGSDASNFHINFTTYEQGNDALDEWWVLSLGITSPPVDENPEKEYLDIPAGTYSISSQTANILFVSSLYHTVLGDGGELNSDEFAVTDGTLTISGDHAGYHVTINLTHADGTFSGYYNGAVEVKNPNVPIDLGDPLTNVWLMDYYPDFREMDSIDLWDFVVSHPTLNESWQGDGWMVRLMFCSPVNSGEPMPDGIYNINGTYEPWSAVRGSLNIGILGAVATYVEADQAKEQYCIVSGTLKSTYSGGQYTIEIDGRTDLGTVITGTVKVVPPAGNSAHYPDSFLWRPFGGAASPVTYYSRLR